MEISHLPPDASGSNAADHFQAQLEMLHVIRQHLNNARPCPCPCPCPCVTADSANLPQAQHKHKSQTKQSAISKSTAKVLAAIAKKINGYKAQDLRSKRNVFNVLHPEKLNTEITNMQISVGETIQLLLNQQLTCFYCSDQLLLVQYEKRAPKQWTLDRIDNTQNHMVGNVVVSCLECNLKRRTQPMQAFHFTRRLEQFKCVLSGADECNSSDDDSTKHHPSQPAAFLDTTINDASEYLLTQSDCLLFKHRRKNSSNNKNSSGSCASTLTLKKSKNQHRRRGVRLSDLHPLSHEKFPL